MAELYKLLVLTCALKPPFDSVWIARIPSNILSSSNRRYITIVPHRDIYVHLRGLSVTSGSIY